MPTKGLLRRLDALQRAGMGEEIGRIVVIAPERWPEAAREAYDAACAAGDRVRQADLIEAQTGERPIFPRRGVGIIREHLPPTVIEVRTHPGRIQ